MAKATNERFTTLILSRREAKAVRDLIGLYVHAATRMDDHPTLVTFTKMPSDPVVELQEVKRALIAASFNEPDDDES